MPRAPRLRIEESGEATVIELPPRRVPRWLGALLLLVGIGFAAAVVGWMLPIAADRGRGMAPAWLGCAFALLGLPGVAVGAAIALGGAGLLLGGSRCRVIVEADRLRVQERLWILRWTWNLARDELAQTAATPSFGTLPGQALHLRRADDRPLVAAAGYPHVEIAALADALAQGIRRRWGCDALSSHAHDATEPPPGVRLQTSPQGTTLRLAGARGAVDLRLDDRDLQFSDGMGGAHRLARASIAAVSILAPRTEGESGPYAPPGLGIALHDGRHHVVRIDAGVEVLAWCAAWLTRALGLSLEPWAEASLANDDAADAQAPLPAGAAVEADAVAWLLMLPPRGFGRRSAGMLPGGLLFAAVAGGGAAAMAILMRPLREAMMPLAVFALLTGAGLALALAGLRLGSRRTLLRIVDGALHVERRDVLGRHAASAPLRDVLAVRVEPADMSVNDVRPYRLRIVLRDADDLQTADLSTAAEMEAVAKRLRAALRERSRR